MRTVALAGTTLSSSRLGFGLSGLHHLYRSRARQALLACAADHGITYFDVAPYYGHGLAERELGVFASFRRSELLIATKLGIQSNRLLSRHPSLMYTRLAGNAALRRLTRRKSFAVPRSYDYGSQAAARSLDESLRALRTEYVDILYLHDPTLARLAEPELLLETLQRLQKAGKVRYFGLAGNAGECSAIIQRYAVMGRLLQIDAADGNDDLETLNAAAVPFHSSYGHFRTRADSVANALAAATRSNREGVILFSTRRVARISEMVTLLSALEAS